MNWTGRDLNPRVLDRKPCCPRTFESIIDRIAAMNLEDRFFGGAGLRLEDRSRKGGLLFADFARERGGHGPGRMSRTEALQEIQLRQGQNFGEDTGMAYDPRTGYAAIQYNHFGPRSAAIENYLYAADLSFGGLRQPQRGEKDSDVCGFRLGALLKPDAYARLRDLGIIHDIEFTVALPGVDRSDLREGRSLSEILNAPLPDGTDTISMRITAAPGRNSKLARGGAMGIVDDLRRLGGEVRRAVVRGKPSQDDPYEKVDLVEERISEDHELVLGRGRRYSRQDRWGALEVTLREWLSGSELRRAEEAE